MFLVSENASEYRVQHRLKKKNSELGMLPLKLTCPACTSPCPQTLLNKGEVGLCPKHYLPSRAYQGLVQLAPLPFFAQFTCNGASSYVACRNTNFMEKLYMFPDLYLFYTFQCLHINCIDGVNVLIWKGAILQG